ncbi:sugar phosphate nucleotidyltransferase [Novosphingobium aerophilum]|uniref:phosphocholine cytidylyltransferase family protein n=1 Tax=Novosphingobium TaxID=165696 RepID=UPI0006C83359|nr:MULTISPECIES: phosphocholine cytidylyltransferase family protein [unclassified Novosphingobium]KPH57528.1 nucleotidyltransferase [Novosphingobium sp. ST904]MPS67553.1 phosphocholine cytidylyltransferase family protein [Novosphingobium sp.]TCM43094.1 choline kinase [Novosphingobium sp. ST904]WRT93184.1 phosphocholine cytidylyltransferase family protein [Novosphingobium sp. RL4]
MIEHAILLSAGQGSRLLPLTAERPKCMIDFSGKSLIEWQIEMLARGGVKRIDVVTGFMTDMLEEHLNAISDPRVEINIRFNPFFKVADNLGSCWIAREAMRGDFLILNGDTLVSEEIVRKVQQGAADADGNPWPITVTVDIKAEGYDSDDMKVERETDGRLVHIGKTLTAQQSNSESIGFLAFRGEGADLFRETVRQAMRTPEGVQHWYLKVIDSIAPTGKVGTVSIEGLDWAEVDFLNDIEIATGLTDTWK